MSEKFKTGDLVVLRDAFPNTVFRVRGFDSRLNRVLLYTAEAPKESIAVYVAQLKHWDGGRDSLPGTERPKVQPMSEEIKTGDFVVLRKANDPLAPRDQGEVYQEWPAADAVLRVRAWDTWMNLALVDAVGATKESAWFFASRIKHWNGPKETVMMPKCDQPEIELQVCRHLSPVWLVNHAADGHATINIMKYDLLREARSEIMSTYRAWPQCCRSDMEIEIQQTPDRLSAVLRCNQ